MKRRLCLLPAFEIRIRTLPSVPGIGAKLAFKAASIVPEVLQPNETGIRQFVFEGKLMLER